MKIDLLDVKGFEYAIFGAMLSSGKTDYDKILNYDKHPDILERGKELAKILSQKDGGHNKFLEQIQYWIIVNAPLYFHKQLDTYRIGVSKSSESTMYKMWKNGLTPDNFENGDKIYPSTIDELNKQISLYKETNDPELFTSIISNLPDGYKQTRLLNINGKSLKNIYKQRKTHKLIEWQIFCEFIEKLPYGNLMTSKER